MSSRDKFSSKKSSNIKRISTYAEKGPSRSMPKKGTIQDKSKIKMSYNQKTASNLKKN